MLMEEYHLNSVTNLVRMMTSQNGFKNLKKRNKIMKVTKKKGNPKLTASHLPSKVIQLLESCSNYLTSYN